MKKIYLFLIAIVFAVNFSYAQWTTGPDNINNTNTGNVGIGTTNPGEKLQVNGNIYVVKGGGSTLFLANSNFVSYVASVENGGSSDLSLGANNVERVRILGSNGNVGIGTTSPVNKLDVQGGNGSVYNTGGPTFFNVGGSATGETLLQLSTSADQSGYSILQSVSAHGSSYGNIAINPNGGNVLIGKAAQTNAGYKLDVAGSVRANEIVVNTTGADFVFHPGYRLFPLSRLKKYIDQNRHLRRSLLPVKCRPTA